MADQHQKGTRFQALHQAAGVFVMANAWDGGSARILAGLGFQALATSSGACAATLGRLDGKVTRDEALAHARNIVAATDAAVSADLEKGFGDSPRIVAETIRLAADVGLVGCSIEDATGNEGKPLYDMNQAVERVAAAVVLNDGSALDLQSLRTWARDFLAAYKVPSRLRVLEALPRNTMGKVMKPDLVSLFQITDSDAAVRP